MMRSPDPALCVPANPPCSGRRAAPPLDRQIVRRLTDDFGNYDDPFPEVLRYHDAGTWIHS